MNDKKYWMVVDQHNIIRGVSDKSPTNAMKVAKSRVGSILWEVFEPVLDKKSIRCSFNIFNIASGINGYYYLNGKAWTMINGIAELDIDINTRENCNSMRSLIDGAYDIVMLYKPQYPSQIEWKKWWLEEARKHGASCD